ncbi:hypothetical protein AB5I41_22885 [Sphingomonas sp. MMS24-JH45]
METSDVFAHTLTKVDLGGHLFTSTYDVAARLLKVEVTTTAPATII